MSINKVELKKKIIKNKRNKKLNNQSELNKLLKNKNVSLTSNQQTTNNTNKNTKIDSEQRKKLRMRLRAKIKEKRGGRATKVEKKNQMNDHIKKLKDNNVNITEYLKNMFPDHKQRKKNKKRIMKMFDEESEKNNL